MADNPPVPTWQLEQDARKLANDDEARLRLLLMIRAWAHERHLSERVAALGARDGEGAE